MAFKNFWIQYKFDNKAHQSKIESEKFIIGRAPDCDLVVNTDVISRKHLRVEHIDGEIYLTDLGSTNGTFLNGRRIPPKKRVDYKTGDQLTVESENTECTFRIIVINDNQAVDANLDEQQIALARKEQVLKQKNDRIRRELEKENYIRAATQSVDNIFENLFFVVKSARFNKEKAIKEAENQSIEMIERAKKEIEDYRLQLENDILQFQEQTKEEARRMINAANDKAQKVLSNARDEAQQISVDAENQKMKTLLEADQSFQDIVSKAQEKYSDIIADAHSQNAILKADNQKLIGNNNDMKFEAERLDREIQELKSQREIFDDKFKTIKNQFDQEEAHFIKLKSKVAELEERSQAAQRVFDVQIPEWQSRIELMKADLLLSENQKVKALNDKNSYELQLIHIKNEIESQKEVKSQQEKRLDELNSKILEAEDNLFKLSRVKQQRNEEIDKEIEYRRDLFKKEEDQKRLSLEEKTLKVEKEIQINSEKAKLQCKEMIEQAKKEAEELLKQSRLESAQTLSEVQAKKEQIQKDTQILLEESKRLASQERLDAQLEAKFLRNEAQSWADETKKKVSLELDIKKQNIDQEIATLKGELIQKTELEKEKILDLAKQQARSVVDSATQESHRLLEEARSESQLLRLKAEEFAKMTKEQAQNEANSLLQESQLKVSKTQSDLEKEIETKKKEHQDEIQQMRTTLLRQLDDQKKLHEQAERDRNQLRSTRLKKELSDVLKARISPFLKDQGQVERVQAIIGKSINAILLDEVDENDIVDVNLSDFDPTHQQNKVKKFWISTAVGLVGLVIFVQLLPSIRRNLMETGRSIAVESEKKTIEKIEKTKKENDLWKDFKPEKTTDYKDTYVDRVIYMQDYVEIELSREYREKWIIALQDFFVHELRLSENNLVPFIAQEANVVRELEEARKKINGNFAEEGIKRMREIEEQFISRVRENVRKRSDYKKIMSFKEKFFIEYSATRFPASPDSSDGL